MDLVRRKGNVLALTALSAVAVLLATFMSTRASANDDREARLDALARTNAIARLADEVGDLRHRVSALESQLKRVKEASQLRTHNLRTDLQRQRLSLAKRIVAARSAAAAKTFVDQWDDKRAAFAEGRFDHHDWDKDDWDHEDWDKGDWDDDDWDHDDDDDWDDD